MDCPNKFRMSSSSKSGTLFCHMVSSAPMSIRQSKRTQRAEQTNTYDLAYFANKIMSHLHQRLHASVIIQLRLYCLSLTHCLVYVEIFGPDIANSFTMGVASSFTRYRFRLSLSISTPISSQDIPSTLPPLLSLHSLQFKATSLLLFHNHLRIPTHSKWHRTPLTTLSTLLIRVDS